MEEITYCLVCYDQLLVSGIQLTWILDAVLDADNLSLVASDWTIKYQEDGPEAMKQLVNFFLRVSALDCQ